MERTPTRPVPVSRQQPRIAPPSPKEDLLELHISPTEVEHLDRTARVHDRDLGKQQANLEWEQTRPKPITIRRKSAIQLACIRDQQYLAAASKRNHRPATPPADREQYRAMRTLIEAPPKMVSPIHEVAYLDDFDLRQFLMPSVVSPIPEFPPPSNNTTAVPIVTPSPPEKEALFNGATIRWNRRFSRTRNLAGERISVNIYHGLAHLTHLNTDTQITRTRTNNPL